MDINAKVPMAVTSVFFNRLIVVRCQNPQCFLVAAMLVAVDQATCSCSAMLTLALSVSLS